MRYISYNNKAFTLIEVLVVISIISFLLSAFIFSINIARLKSRDVERISNLSTFSRALELYYHDHGYYPRASGRGYYGFNYKVINSAGQCADTLLDEIHFDNSTSLGLLEELYDNNYMSIGDWFPPLAILNQHNSRYNCRYVSPCNEIVPGGDRLDCDRDPDYYLLHCFLEGSDLAKNDGGGNNEVYEITGGKIKLCVTSYP